MTIGTPARVLWTATVPVEFADERIFGERAHALSWADAMRVTPRCIVPVRVAAVAIEGFVDEAVALVHDDPALGHVPQTSAGVTLVADALALIHLWESGAAGKVFSFHGRCKQAQLFADVVKILYRRRFRRDVAAFSMSGETAMDDRTQIMDAFSRAERHALLSSVRVAAEGIDAPECDTVFPLNPVAAAERIMQQVGRGTRLGAAGAPEKSHALYVLPLFVAVEDFPSWPRRALAKSDRM